jgi:hypothetical protein
MTFGPIATTAYTANGVTFHMARLPPGRFMDGEDARRRELLVSRPFELGVTLVTQALWRAVMGSSPAQFKGEDRPVEQVSHDDVQAFLARLPGLGLTGFRLPTEAEWAWSARCARRHGGQGQTGYSRWRWWTRVRQSRSRACPPRSQESSISRGACGSGSRTGQGCLLLVSIFKVRRRGPSASAAAEAGATTRRTCGSASGPAARPATAATSSASASSGPPLDPRPLALDRPGPRPPRRSPALAHQEKP